MTNPEQCPDCGRPLHDPSFFSVGDGPKCFGKGLRDCEFATITRLRQRVAELEGLFVYLREAAIMLEQAAHPLANGGDVETRQQSVYESYVHVINILHAYEAKAASPEAKDGFNLLARRKAARLVFFRAAALGRRQPALRRELEEIAREVLSECVAKPAKPEPCSQCGGSGLPVDSSRQSCHHCKGTGAEPTGFAQAICAVADALPTSEEDERLVSEAMRGRLGAEPTGETK